VSISLEKLNNESWFKISDYDSMRPFFMSIVSDSNHWMFISSNGGLTAGRKNSKYALFPYYTDDKLTELRHTTGSKTIIQIGEGDKRIIWEPFSVRDTSHQKVSRNLYKNRYGNKIMFEEINHDFGLTYRYQWNSSNNYGFVKKSSLINSGDSKQKVVVLDGIQNIMPYGVSPDLQTKSSNLVDAYKRNELDKESGLGIYALSAIIVDKAEPSEALKANAVWSIGIDDPTYLVSSKQLDKFRKEGTVQEELDVKAEKGAYFVKSEMNLSANTEKNWSIVANVNLDHAHLARLIKLIKESSGLQDDLNDDIEQGTKKLVQLVAGADGLQLTNDQFKDTRHYSNTLFNIMRGGTFDLNYRIEKKDFVGYLRKASKVVVDNNDFFINNLNDIFDKAQLNRLLSEVDDADMLRLSKEYLPLKFSRRHGDPSRPWNQFSINTNSEIDGSKILDYEGNWRDIFQNWEALVYSYPDFLESMIYKFLNATTFDGYNPYRVTKDGFDWETIEPDDPWSYIGYWGDHQIIYLLKFLEFYQKYSIEDFKGLFESNNFVYANVPYKIKSYKDIARDPKDTIEFDEDLDSTIRARLEDIGADGALLTNTKDDIHRVNFLEKILATILAKVSNFIPEAGIWMNTQRPEWNDANNALVGNGVSMVTLYYLRRFLKFFEPIITNTDLDTISVSEEIGDMFTSILAVLEGNKALLNGIIDDEDRKKITEGLGEAGSKYREKVYNEGFSGDKTTVSLLQIKNFIHTALEFLEHSIEANKRDDNLYHAYNIMSMNDDGISISYLDEMLEGQVAALSSGYLSTEEELSLLDGLRNSTLYRQDQQSYILYPNKSLPGFLEKNNIPEDSVKKSRLLQQLISDYNLQIIIQDVSGKYHFNGNFTNAGDLKTSLTSLPEKYTSLVEDEEGLILQIFEDVFNHKAFTGRSGTFFGYEGLGSIYWHMVSKLHLAVQEVCQKAVEAKVDPKIFKRLATHFDEIGAGIGVHKSPKVYGAFPTDPYSHTPENRGAQQPGMTGQVKEDILVRMGELGIQIKHGKLNFEPSLLKKDEFSDQSRTFKLVSLDQKEYTFDLPKNALGFTCCQVPVVYQFTDNSGLEVQFSDGSSKEFTGNELDEVTTSLIFNREGSIKRILVFLQESSLR